MKLSHFLKNYNKTREIKSKGHVLLSFDQIPFNLFIYNMKNHITHVSHVQLILVIKNDHG